MKLFRLPKRDPRMMEDESTLMRLLRYAVILLLFGGAVLGFWLNNQRRMEMMKRPPVYGSGVGGWLSAEQRTELDDFAEKFRQSYGIVLRISISDDAPAAETLKPGPDGNSIVLCLSPRSQGVVFEPSPLAGAALGKPLTLYLRHMHFLPYYTEDAWPQGLASALNLMVKRLDRVLLAQQF